ncbi:hypothetical protein [Streptomyces erythrochromogenes]|uniref:hypothetical protein n=1 Tax=Streptomyces erythrochromogenes TaxID=285574 RepID=UPI00340B092E
MANRITMHGTKSLGAALAALLIVGGATGCESGTKESSGKAAPAGVSAQPSRPAAVGPAPVALTAAYRTTSAAKSAKVRMTMSVDTADGVTIEMTGVQGWDPNVMDVTMKGGAPGGDDSETTRMIMMDGVTYTEMSAGMPLSTGADGKRWMKLDLAAIGQNTGGAGLLTKLSGGVGGAGRSQDPAKQLALLLASPNVKHLGAEKVGGTDAEHYKGTLSFEEMLAADGKAEGLSPDERALLVEAMKKGGIKGYDMDVWVNKDGYPVRTRTVLGMPEGSMTTDAHYSDYGTGVTVQAPPANETFDLFGLLKELGGKAGAGA